MLEMWSAHISTKTPPPLARLPLMAHKYPRESTEKIDLALLYEHNAHSTAASGFGHWCYERPYLKTKGATYARRPKCKGGPCSV